MRIQRIILLVALCACISAVHAESNDLCMDGRLLFREDFGGNDPSDPRVGQDPVQGMTYNQLRNDYFGIMRSGSYLVTKQGYCNGDTSVNNLPQNRGSQWHLQDDHTYPNDVTRGYLLEIDGRGDNSAFYSKTIDNLCAGSRLTFSAYVANVLSWSLYLRPGYEGYYAYPQLKFVLTDPASGTELATYDTGEIPFDSTYMGDYQAWRYSSKWHLVGMNFTVPNGVDRVQLTIYNAAVGASGNDFALDDIEIRQCVPTVTIVAPDSVCPNEPCSFQIEITNEELFSGPLQYQWWYRSPEYPSEWRKVGGNTPSLLRSPFQAQHVGWYKIRVAQEGYINDEASYIESDEVFVTFKKCEPDLCMDGTLLYKDDFGGNDVSDPRVGQNPVPGMSYTQMNNDRFGAMGSGRYLVTKSGYCNGDTAKSMRENGYIHTWESQWILQDDHTYPDDRTRGYFVEIDGAGGEKPFYATTIQDLCPGTRLTFSAYVVNVSFYEWIQKRYRQNSDYVYPRMKFVLKDPETGDILAEQSTGDIQPDVTKEWNVLLNESAEWQLVGMEFTVPEGVDAIQMFIYNDVAGNGTGNDFAMDDIEIHLCLPTPEITSDHTACLYSAYQFAVDFSNDGTLVEPLEYKWWFSPDSVIWVEKPDFIGKNPELSAVQKANSGWYKVAVSGAGNIESVNCRAMSEPFLLQTTECEAPYVYVVCDTTACHEDKIVFHGRTYAVPGAYKDTVFNPTGMDTIYQVTVTDERSFRELSITITMGNPPPHPWENVTETGVYYDTLVNAAGCDSIVICSIYFKERCMEFSEESHSFCDGTIFSWHGLEFSAEGNYRDTLWHSMPEACDTAFLLHLHVLPVSKDTTYATIHYGDEYPWEGELWGEENPLTHVHMAANGCDSLTTLQLTVDYSLTVEQIDLESGCSEDEQMILHLLLSRLVDSVQITFSDDAKKAGLLDSIVYFHAKEGDIFIPHRGARPGRFICNIALVHDTAVLYTTSFAFTLLYPASVLEQAWNDVVAVLTHDYNGGYDFTAFQWYENGVLLTGENHSYLYRPLIMGGEYSALLTEADGTQAMTCPLIAKHQEDISLYPTIIGPRRMLRCFVPEEAELVLYDALGRVVGRYHLSVGETQILAPGTTGVYIACIITHSEPKERPYKLIVR